MRKYLLLIFVLIIVVIIHEFAFADIKTEIVIKGQWGNKSNEFGYDKDAHTPSGPWTFCVDKSGNIYINDDDYDNDRFKKYNKKGELVKIKSYNGIFKHIHDMTINDEGRLFLMAIASGPPSRWIIAELDSEFNTIRECLPHDSLGNVIVGGRRIVAIGHDVYFDDPLTHNIYKLLDFKVAQKVDGPLIIGTGFLIAIDSIGYVEKYPPENIRILYEVETKIAHISFDIPHRYHQYYRSKHSWEPLINMDTKGRVYIRTNWSLLVYSCVGSLIDTVSLRFRGGCPGFGCKIGLDDNYYHMNCDLDGFYIYRYTVTED
jgi:hypothetical protein